MTRKYKNVVDLSVGRDSFQETLLNRTGISWSTGPNGEVVMDMESLTTPDFEELLGAGCFTYHLEKITMSPTEKHNLAFQVARKYGKRFVKSKDFVTHSGNVLKSTMVVERRINGLDVLVHIIVDKDGVDTGMYKIAWGNP